MAERPFTNGCVDDYVRPCQLSTISNFAILDSFLAFASRLATTVLPPPCAWTTASSVRTKRGDVSWTLCLDHFVPVQGLVEGARIPQADFQ